MAVVEELVNVTQREVPEVIQALGSVALWLQALGILVLIWILIQIINFAFNYKKQKRLKIIEEKLDRIDRKLGKAYSKK